jgi:hypothetical protein
LFVALIIEHQVERDIGHDVQKVVDGKAEVIEFGLLNAGNQRLFGVYQLDFGVGSPNLPLFYYQARIREELLKSPELSKKFVLRMLLSCFKIRRANMAIQVLGGFVLERQNPV